MNWLIIDGLGRYGYHAAAPGKPREMVAKGGCHEYFDPDGTPPGAATLAGLPHWLLDLIQYQHD